MSLENVLTALKCSMNNNLGELNEELLHDEDVRGALTTFFAEQETRPELIKMIRAPSLMRGYLALELGEREEMEGFRHKNPEYLFGEGEELKKFSSNSENVEKLRKEIRAVEQTLKLFEFYLKEKNKNKNLRGLTFGSGYLKNNESLKRRFGSLGGNLYKRVTKHIIKSQKGFKGLIKLASEINPLILKYSDKIELTKIDCMQNLLQLFNYFLEHRKKGDLFNISYISRNDELNEQFDNLGKKVYYNIKRYSKSYGGFGGLIELISAVNPEISHYSTQKRLIKKEGVDSILKFFDFFLDKRKKFELFNINYLISNQQFQRKFFKEGYNLYKNAQRNGIEFDLLLKFATEKNKRIGDYRTIEGIMPFDGPKQIIEIFDFYMRNRKNKEPFNIVYVTKNKKLKKRFGNFGENMYRNSLRYFKDLGFYYFIKLAAEQRPEILQHWHYSPRNQRSGGSKK